MRAGAVKFRRSGRIAAIKFLVWEGSYLKDLRSRFQNVADLSQFSKFEEITFLIFFKILFFLLF